MSGAPRSAIAQPATTSMALWQLRRANFALQGEYHTLVGRSIWLWATRQDVNGGQAAQNARTSVQERSRKGLLGMEAVGWPTYLLSTLLGCGAASNSVDGSLAAQNAPHAVACKQQEAVAWAEVNRAALWLRGHAHSGRRTRAIV